MKEQDLTPLERFLLAKVRAGEPFAPFGFDGTVPPDEDEPAHDIRAAVLEALIDGLFGGRPIGRKGLLIAGFRITGALNLSNAKLDFPLMLRHCLFTDTVTLDRTRAHLINFGNSRVKGELSANQIRIKSDWILDSLTASKIACREGRIGGQLSMNNAILETAKDGIAFRGQGLHAAQGVFLRDLKATGTVDLASADIGGQLSMTDANLDAGEQGVSLRGQGLRAAQGVFMRKLAAIGTVDLNTADLGGQLSLGSAKLNAGEAGKAFNGQGLHVENGIFLQNIEAIGTLDLTGANVSGQVAMVGAKLNAGEQGIAFRGQGLRTTESLFLKNLWTIGRIDLNAADIGGQLAMTGATLRALCDQPAFEGSTLRAAEAVLLDDLNARGMVRLLGAQIGGTLKMGGATFTNPGGVALDLEKASIDRAGLFALSSQCEGVCEMRDTRIDTLVLDTDPGDWPAGLTVSCPDIRIGALPTYTRSARDGWIDWLNRQAPWSPHAYQQVAARLREAGHEECAKAVYISMRRRQRKAEHETFLATIPEPQRNKRLNGYFPERFVEWVVRKFDAWVLDGVIGYGYRPMRAAGWMAGLILLGMVIFQQTWDARLMSPAQATIFEAIPANAVANGTWGEGFYACANKHPPTSTALVLRTSAEENCLPRDYPGFIPLFYSFDLAIPLLDMRPEKFWTVNSSAPWGWAVLCWYYFQIIAGSLLTGLFLAAVTGIVKKE